MTRILLPVLIFAAVLYVAPAAQATFNQDWGEYENDWTIVADKGWVGGAGGMTNCTARTYCVSCEVSLETNLSFCAKAYRDAYCKCAYFYQNNVRRCLSSGACLYRP